ncbi:MAG: nucleotidyltransferase domain-containing protein [Thermoguttaceae bacterium]
MDQGTDQNVALEHATKYAERVRTEFSPDAIVVFGSYVNGTPREESDIDIAVIFNDFRGAWLETAARLWRLSYDVDDRIEPHMLDRTKDPAGFVTDVLKAGRRI